MGLQAGAREVPARWDANQGYGPRLWGREIEQGMEAAAEDFAGFTGDRELQQAVPLLVTEGDRANVLGSRIFQ